MATSLDRDGPRQARRSLQSIGGYHEMVVGTLAQSQYRRGTAEDSGRYSHRVDLGRRAAFIGQFPGPRGEGIE